MTTSVALGPGGAGGAEGDSCDAEERAMMRKSPAGEPGG